MPTVNNFTSDNSGSPDIYSLNHMANRLRIREKDLTVATLAPYNVYLPYNGTAYKTYQGGEEAVVELGVMQLKDFKAFAMETVGVATSVFVVVEEP